MNNKKVDRMMGEMEGGREGGREKGRREGERKGEKGGSEGERKEEEIYGVGVSLLHLTHTHMYVLFFSPALQRACRKLLRQKQRLKFASSSSRRGRRRG